jgi:hypothetical protein
MGAISVSTAILLIKGIPEGFLVVLALHVFTRIKVEPVKYFFLSVLYIGCTYMIRFLPITLGVNTILSFFVLVLIFQLVYKGKLSKVANAIVAAVVIIMLVAVSEVLNVLLLNMIYGQAEAKELFNSTVGMTKSLSSMPSTVFTAVFIFIGYLILKKYDQRVKKHGKAGKEAGG